MGDRLTTLHANIGRALTQAQFGALGRDLAHQKKRSGEAQHLLVPQQEPLPAQLVGRIDDLTDGMLGLVLDPPQYRGTVLHLRELRDGWERRIDRTTLEAFVLLLVSACEWFLDDAMGNKSYLSFISKYPAYERALGELRATRNCIVHNGGIVDDQYLFKAGADSRATKGELLPLDWTYAYDRTLTVLEFAGEVGN